MADRDTRPGRHVLSPIRCTGHMIGKSCDQVAAARRVVDVEHRMNADIGLGPVAQDQRLNVVEGERYPVTAKPGL